MRGGKVLAHRASYEMHVGPIPPCMVVMHRCDVRCCVNPAHLQLGTYSENTLDMLAKGRGVKGERWRKVHAVSTWERHRQRLAG